jgi:hypothetical protein
MVLLVVKKKRAMRTTTNYLLANLAMADLLSLIALFPVVLHWYFEHPSGQVGHFVCVFLTEGNLCAMALSVSVITLGVLAFERYMALLKPMRVHWRLNEENVKYAIASVWTISIAFVIPHFVRTKYTGTLHEDCDQIWASHKEQFIYLALVFIFLFIIPYLVIIFCYFSIIKGIYFTNEILPMNTGNTEADARSKKRIVEVLLIVTLVFTICVGTFAMVNALRVTGIVQGESFVFHLAGAFLFANASVNPIVYAFRSSNYKQGFREILGMAVAA